MPDSEADRHFARLREAFEGEPGVAAGRLFSAEGLKVDGKIVAMLVKGALVLKLPKPQVDGMIADGTGNAFDPGHGRRMKEWVVVDSDPAGWLDLERAACAFVRGVQRK